MKENRISGATLDAALRVHRTLGPGLLESVYEAALAIELRKRGLRVRSQVPIDEVYEGVALGLGFRADLIVEELVLVELKSVTALAPVHRKQTLTYIRLAALRVGLLLNFGAELLKDGVVRLVDG